jgi:hypothetical protein
MVINLTLLYVFANGGASFIRCLPNLSENSSAMPNLLKPSAANERTVDKLINGREALGANHVKPLPSHSNSCGNKSEYGDGWLPYRIHKIYYNRIIPFASVVYVPIRSPFIRATAN